MKMSKTNCLCAVDWESETRKMKSSKYYKPDPPKAQVYGNGSHNFCEAPGGRGKTERKDSENIEFTVPLKPKVRVISGIHNHLVVTAGKVKRKHEVIQSARSVSRLRESMRKEGTIRN